jgi:predicted permease
MRPAASGQPVPGHGARKAAWRVLRSTLSNPLPWSIALGALFAAGGVQLPGPLAVIVRMLADAATPVALFTIGAVLWRASQHAHTRTRPADYVPVALIKLFVHPLLVLALGAGAGRIGARARPGAHDLRADGADAGRAFRRALGGVEDPVLKPPAAC